MTEQLAAENVETAPQEVEEHLNEEQANSEGVETTVQPEALEQTAAQDDSFIPDNAMTPAVQKRINKLTWEKHEAERQAQVKIQELEEKLAGQSQAPQQPEVAPKPKLADFNYDDEAYSEALVDWKVEQRMSKIKPAEPTAPQQPDPTVAAWAQKQSAYAAEHSDYVQMASAMGSAVQSQAVQQYIVSSETGPKLHHHLLNNVAELYRIQALPEWQQGAELVKIESKLTQKKPVAKSNAPEPVKTVTNGKPAPKAKGFKGGKLFPQ